MTSVLREMIDSQREQGAKLLSIYLTAGFPEPDATLPLLDAIVSAGADLVELGIPFSDPLADGPTIQNASQQALRNGMTLSKSLRLLGDFTRRHQQPAILMGYSNPFLHYGWEKLLDEARAQGASGFIIPDLPPEESAVLCDQVRDRNMNLIFLVAPNTTDERIKLVNRLTGAFIYAVSLTGVTGSRNTLPPETTGFLQRLRSKTDHPILVGFGISNAATARSIAPYCDGVIVGSAVIQEIAREPDLSTAIQGVKKLVAEIKSAL